jgi:hypothetical protein
LWVNWNAGLTREEGYYSTAIGPVFLNETKSATKAKGNWVFAVQPAVTEESA